ncbi:GNAT family N-acetyltransferase [Nocardioides sp. LHG3406-4]|uniref:GNAT family N-acetyltransferase n=1 Tax=Nocardioides sp. LHG3406-4 TaxID=2804575 RepID=UPI003CEE0C59
MLHPPPGVSLRLATLEDVEACARLHLECWRAAYSPIVDSARLEAALDLERSARNWRTQIEGGRERLIAVRDDRPVGFVSSGPGRDDDPPTELELYALYVAEAEWGRGIGRLLLAEELGGDSASLWVFEDNARARGFYARQGFAPDGARKKDDELDAWEIRMVRRVDRPVRA